MSQTRILESELSAAKPMAAALLSVALAGSSAGALELATSESGLSLRVEAGDGTYEIASRETRWTYGGSFNLSLSNFSNTMGSDRLGDYRQISFEWANGITPMTGYIRLYDHKPLVLFSQTSGTKTELPPPAFPAFTRLPKNLNVFSHGLHEFAPPQFSPSEISAPWLLFDDQANALIISPASHFMVASMVGDGKKLVASGFNPNLRNLPAGFTQQTIVAVGKGINRTWETWGRSILDLKNAKRPANDADAVLKYLGYWTDNGANYYYNYDLDKGYAATLENLLIKFRQKQIPIRYLQLDSWWYYKSTTDADGKVGKAIKANKLPAGEWNRYGGTLEYKAHTDLFTNGLEAFHKTIGMPMVTHARWIDPASPYHDKYKTSGLSIIDPKWWDEIATYLKANGVATYEQDWLDRIFTYSPEFTSNPDVAESFLDNMARACREQGITLQYCMPYASHFMQGSRYENLTTIRTSGDRFNTNRWHNFLYTSRLASALGIWPWADVFKSPETGNVLLATLSAGPVGIGDAMDAATATNLVQTVRTDGIIVKPDASIVPLDRCYIADAQQLPMPLVSSTFTKHGEIRTGYVFAFNRPKTPVGEVNFTLSELGVTAPAYVHDYFAGTGQLMDGEALFSGRVPKGGLSYYVVAPVGKSGIAFLGDSGKFVGTGRQRIAALSDEAGRLTTTVTFAKGEEFVVLHGYASFQPKASVNSGHAGTVKYDARTKYFSVEVKPDANAPFDESSGDPVRQVIVTLTTSN